MHLLRSGGRSVTVLTQLPTLSSIMLLISLFSTSSPVPIAHVRLQFCSGGTYFTLLFFELVHY